MKIKNELPQGWEWKKLADLVTFLYGYPFESSMFNEDGKGVPIIRIRDLKNSLHKTYYLGEYDNSYIVKKSDLLIGMDGEFNIVKWRGNEALLNQRICKLILKSDTIYPDYAYYALKGILKNIEDATPYSTVKHLSAKILNEILIPLPPIEVQRKILAILQRAEALTELRINANLMLDQMILSIFLKMFGDPINNPMGWEKVKVKDVTVFHKQGLYTNSSYTNTGIKLLRISDIDENGRLNYDTMPFLDLDEKTIEQFKLCKGDFVFARSGVSIGRCGIVERDIPCVFGSFIIKFRFNDRKINNDFFLYFMKSPINQLAIKGYSHGSANPNINAKNIMDLDIYLPPLNLQLQFSNIVKQFESLNHLQCQSSNEINLLQKTVIEKSFTGELVL